MTEQDEIHLPATTITRMRIVELLEEIDVRVGWLEQDLQGPDDAHALAVNHIAKRINRLREYLLS